MEYNKDMKPTIAILIGILILTALLYGLFWAIIEMIFNLALKLSGGM